MPEPVALTFEVFPDQDDTAARARLWLAAVADAAEEHLGRNYGEIKVTVGDVQPDPLRTHVTIELDLLWVAAEGEHDG